MCGISGEFFLNKITYLVEFVFVLVNKFTVSNLLGNVISQFRENVDRSFTLVAIESRCIFVDVLYLGDNSSMEILKYKMFAILKLHHQFKRCLGELKAFRQVFDYLGKLFLSFSR